MPPPHQMKLLKESDKMKQLGNLAIVCAKRPEVLLQLYNSQVTVHVGQGPQRAVLCAAWDDDEQISRIIHELNFGAYRLDVQKECRSMRGQERAA